MRKKISKLFNRRTVLIISFLAVLVVTSSFLIPVSNQRLILHSWCGIGSNGVAELSFSKDGTFSLTEIDVSTNLPSTHHETGTWIRTGQWKLQINSTIESSNQQHIETYYLRSLFWGFGLKDANDEAGVSRKLFVSQCEKEPV